MQEIPHYIAGQRTAGSGGRRGDVYNPAWGEVTARLCLADAGDVDAAVAAAQAAWPAWAETSPLKRARVMFKFKEILEREAPALAALISTEHGKTVPDALGEVTRGLEVVEFACGIPQ
ncbi:MAG: aldehyde dehydrogenase family protein, partial [Microvirgula sp.]